MIELEDGGSSTEDQVESESAYGKKFINDYFNKHNLPYEIVAEGVRLNEEEKRRLNIKIERPRFWIVKYK